MTPTDIASLLKNMAQTVIDAGAEFTALSEAKASDAFIQDLLKDAKAADPSLSDAELAKFGDVLALGLNVLGLVLQHKGNPLTLGKTLLDVISEFFRH